MAIRRILKFPDAELKHLAHPVKEIDGTVDTLLTDMTETMYAAPGIGLAATQLGVDQRAIVVDINPEEKGKQLLKLVNPVIAEREGSIVWEEGCLSVVDFTAEVKRSAKILMKAWTVEQKEIEIEAEDLLAVALQHELDHLDGKLFIDRISSLKRDMYRRKIKKMIRDGIPIESTTPHKGI